jgi:hypothetical protein
VVTISVSLDERQAQDVQIFILGADAALAFVGGGSQITVWLSREDAHVLGERLAAAL